MLGTVCVLIGLWLVLPLLVIIPISFSGEDSFAFPPRSWTLQRYLNLADPAWTNALVNSLAVAVLSAIVAAGLGTLAAFSITRSRSRWASLLQILVLAPQVVPVIIVGVGVYLVFLRWQLTGTVLGFVLVHSAMTMPFFVIPVAAALQTFDRLLSVRRPVRAPGR